MPKAFNEWHWEITRRCNLRCSHCITACGEAPDSEMSTEAALLAVKRMAELGCSRLMVTGGEPLVREDILTILKACKSRGIELGLLTNGFTVNRYIVSELSSLISSVGVSLDGAAERTHDTIRGRGSFKKACRAILHLSKTLPVIVHVTVSSNNFREVEATIKKAMKLGASRVHVSEISIFGRAGKNRSVLALDSDQRKILLRLAENKAEGGEYLCKIDFSAVYLSYDGFVYPCSEVAIKKPNRFLADIASESCVEDLVAMSEKWIVPDFFCCYVVYEGPNIFFCLRTENPCYVAIKEISQ